jgi:hypothetical protein
MPSLVGLLEDRELAARQRVESLLEEMDRLMAVLRKEEAAWQRLVVTRETVSEVLSAPPVPDEAGAVEVAGGSVSVVPDPGVMSVPEGTAGRPRSVVPVRRTGLGVSVLSPDYQQIMTVVAGRGPAGDGAVTCREITAALGLKLVAAKVEGVRSKAKRLAERGWLTEAAPGRFSVVPSPGAGS